MCILLTHILFFLNLFLGKYTSRKGRDVTIRLQEYAGAKSIELHGGNACYFEFPDEFCAAMVKELGLT